MAGARGQQPPRAAAARILQRILDRHESLADALPAGLAHVAPGDRALVQELCYGTMRWLPRLERVLTLLLERPLRSRDGDVRALLLLGLYQLDGMHVPAHAAVAGTVEAARALRKAWAASLTNALLRRFQREREQLLSLLADDPAVRFAHPRWLIDAVATDWPDDWQAILAAGNERPPMVLRVNLRHISRDDYLQRLAAAGLSAHPLAHAGAGVVLDSPVDVAELPGFGDGLVSVQDGAAQLAAPLVEPGPGMRLLDACAAPGGKTGHLLELAPADADVVAVDVDGARLQRVADNLGRLGLSAELMEGDVAAPEAWWDGRPFDRILLDAPCSATGVIRRHPDIKHLRRPDDVDALAARQDRLLEACWRMLAPGGRLVYATCSVLGAENWERVAGFAAGQPDARPAMPEAGWGRPRGDGRQVLPGEDGMDGFFYACIERRRESG